MAYYLELIKEYGRVSNTEKYKCKLFGSFGVEVGDLDSCVHIW
jgi:hypothetical protein